MKLIDVVSIVHADLDVDVADDFSGEILTAYNGKDSIDPKYNQCEVSLIDVNNNHLIIEITTEEQSE